MATQSPDSQFTECVFTDKELEILPGFTPLQKQFLQNELAVAASEKVALTIDTLDIQGSLQKEAELHGRIGVLKYLLSLNPQPVKEI